MVPCANKKKLLVTAGYPLQEYLPAKLFDFPLNVTIVVLRPSAISIVFRIYLLKNLTHPQNSITYTHLTLTTVDFIVESTRILVTVRFHPCPTHLMISTRERRPARGTH